MAPRNNIAQHYPRAAKLLLVRWRVAEGMPPAVCRRKAAAAWPDLPAIHDRTWASWTDSDDYRELRDLVTGEQAERERLSDLFQAAGGADALADVATAAGYALASRAMALCADAEDAAEVRKLMSAIKDARAVGAEQTKDDYEARIQAIETEHAQEIAEMQAELAQAKDEIARLRVCLVDHKIDPDAIKTADAGLSDEALREIEERAGLL